MVYFVNLFLYVTVVNPDTESLHPTTKNVCAIGGGNMK